MSKKRILANINYHNIVKIRVRRGPREGEAQPFLRPKVASSERRRHILTDVTEKKSGKLPLENGKDGEGLRPKNLTKRKMIAMWFLYIT